MKHLLVLSGGFGTRLKEVLKQIPKPLAPVGGRPFISYLLDIWFSEKIQRITFLLHHEARQFIDYFEMKKQESPDFLKIDYLIEPTPLGTGGSVANAVQTLAITEPFLVANGDTYIGSGIPEISAIQPPAIAVVKVSDTGRYGSVRLMDSRVDQFLEKQSSTGPGFINAGLYSFIPDFFAEWAGENISLEREILPKLAAEGRLRAACLDTDFIDIGIPEDYKRFMNWIESKKLNKI